MMGLPPPGWRLWVLLGAAAAALLQRGCSGFSSSNHSLKVFLMGVSEPSQGLPQFIAGGFVDDQLVAGYDSNGRRLVPRVSWAEKLRKEDPHLWHTQTMILLICELSFTRELGSLQSIYNHSGGLHTLQLRTGCELNAGGQKRGHYQLGYDGRDFIAFDKETLSWTAADAPAQSFKETWEAEPAVVPRMKEFLEVECTQWLQKYLRYGKEALQRREPPVVKVTRRASGDSLVTLLCRAYGFYPREINATWRKGREVTDEDDHGVVSPNSDGSYYTWLSITINPKERSRFRCHMEHDGLLEPLDVDESASVPLAPLVGVTLMVAIVLLLLTGVVSCIKKRRERAAQRTASSG